MFAQGSRSCSKWLKPLGIRSRYLEPPESAGLRGAQSESAGLREAQNQSNCMHTRIATMRPLRSRSRTNATREKSTARAVSGVAGELNGWAQRVTVRKQSSDLPAAQQTIAYDGSSGADGPRDPRRLYDHA